jgi:hypothetical protein
MYDHNKKDSCRVPRHGTAGSGSGVQRVRPPSQGYEGQAAAERRGQAAACMQELQHVRLQLSATRSTEQGHHVHVSDSSSASDRWRHAAGQATHVKSKEDDSAAHSTAPPRSAIPARALGTARTQDPCSTPAGGELLRAPASRPVAAAGEASKGQRATSRASELTPPSPSLHAAAAAVADACEHASYLSVLAGGLQGAAAAAGLGLARRGEARAGGEAWRAGAGCLAAQRGRACGRGGDASSVAPTPVGLLQRTAGRIEQQQT